MGKMIKNWNFHRKKCCSTTPWTWRQSSRCTK